MLNILAYNAERRTYSVKVGHNFKICMPVELGTVLLVKLIGIFFAPNAVCQRICALGQWVGENEWTFEVFPFKWFNEFAQNEIF